NVSAGHIRATRETEHGFDTYELNGPAVLSMAHARSADGSRDGNIDVWTASDLVDDLRENDKRFGQTGSPTRVLAVRDVTPERAGERAGSAEEAATRIRQLAADRPAGTTAWEKPAHLAKEPG